MWLRWSAVALVSAGLVAGCDLLLGVDGVDAVPGGAAGAGGAGTGGGGIGGMGGMQSACDPTDCDEMDTECLDFACDPMTNACDMGTLAAEGTDCDDGSGPATGLCDGTGMCLPKSCTNGSLDGNETGVDCGGACNVSANGKCNNTIACMVSEDCKSNVCNNNFCEPCTDASDCEGGTYCNVDNTQGQGGGGGADPTRGAICEPTKTNGENCGNSGGNDECLTGFCTDGICCDSACDAPDCQACVMASTGQPDGACAPVLGGTDPDNDCVQSLGSSATNGCEGHSCSGTSAACAPAASGVTCRMSTDVCDIAELCDGLQLGCPADNVQPDGASVPVCNGYLCDGNQSGCPTSCGDNGDCDVGYMCNASNNCQLNQANGSSCNNANQCLSGFCVDGVCCDTACNAPDCESCLAASTGLANGTCAPVMAGTDPDNDCTPSLSTCEAHDCSGSAASCEPVTAGVVCRAAAGVCDAEEQCDGMIAACPADVKQPATTVCNPAAGSCDVAEMCDGMNNACPLDVVLPLNTTCRPAADLCDAIEVCDGTSPACPADQPLPMNIICRPTAGDCDVAEVCDGVSFSCQADAFIADNQPSTMGMCNPYLCDGMMASCPMFCVGNEDCVAGLSCVGNMCQ